MWHTNQTNHHATRPSKFDSGILVLDRAKDHYWAGGCERGGERGHFAGKGGVGSPPVVRQASELVLFWDGYGEVGGFLAMKVCVCVVSCGVGRMRRCALSRALGEFLSRAFRYVNGVVWSRRSFANEVCRWQPQ